MRQVNWRSVYCSAALLACTAEPVAAEATGTGARNLMRNPSAEVVVPFRDYPEKDKIWLSHTDLVPRGWGWYPGGGKGTWGVTDQKAHSGTRSVFLTFRDWVALKDGGKCASMALTLGGEGHCGRFNRIRAEPGQTFGFSFWMQGDIPSVKVTLFFASTDGKRAVAGPTELRGNGHLTGIKTAFGHIVVPKRRWTRYHGRFTVGADAKAFCLLIWCANPRLLEPGQTIYVDDAEIWRF